MLVVKGGFLLLSVRARACAHIDQYHLKPKDSLSSSRDRTHSKDSPPQKNSKKST